MSSPVQLSSDIENQLWVSDLSEDLLIQCMRCGLCLAVCPTYSIYHSEKASPRGRLALMLAVKNGQLELSEEYAATMNLCLGCLACQSACPAGVNFGHLLETARDESERLIGKKRNPLFNHLRNWLMEHLLRGPHGLEPLMPVLRLYQALGIQRLNLARILPGYIGDWERLLPPLPRRTVYQQTGMFIPARPPKRGRVGLLTGCLENTLLADMCVSTARLLVQNGFEVEIPTDQECCGALPAHIGEMEIARRRARKNIEVFEDADVDYVVSDAAGCSAQLKEYGQLLEDDPAYCARARVFSSKVRDATEILADYLPLRGRVKRMHLRVAYDDPCHLMHAQKIFSQPRIVLESIPGIELIELPEADWCCGSAGTYNLTHPKEADLLLERKMEHVRHISPDVLVTANTGCYIQLLAGVRKFGLEVRVMHINELIAEYYLQEGEGE